ncbi:protein trichome birefringence-like 14 isoform X2 [Wolffia australiana]
MQPKMNKGFYGLRGKQLSFALVAVVCTFLLIWAWENTPLVPSLLQQQWPPDTFSAEKLGNSSQELLEERQKEKSTNSSVKIATAQAPIINPTKKNKCDYGVGRWVPDTKRPLYSGFSCKRWLSEMWACRLSKRTDFSYEGYRWQPDGCEMPIFDGQTFLDRMKGKTIALVGDSLGRQQFQSLMCMVSGGDDVSPATDDVGREFGLVRARGAVRPDGWAYRFPSTNTTILFYWSASLCELEPVNGRFAMHLDRPVEFLRRFISRFDVLVLNTGHHWNRGKLTANRWDMYVGGAPLADRRLAEIWRARNLTLHSVVRWVGAQLAGHPRGLTAFLRSISPRHFAGGDWNTGGSCGNTTPLRGGDRVGGVAADKEAAAAAAGTGVHVLDITALSALRDEAHVANNSLRAPPGVYDCLHWCLPGVPDTWNEILFARLSPH